jgi:aspartyl-tRNA(Asn)/glutamyl-tRNA(Gln) amidotransferase subunit C
MKQFTIEDVEKIAKLSRLDLSDEEKEIFAQQFSSILDYFEVLNSAEVPEEMKDRDEHQLCIAREDVRENSPVAPSQFSPYLEGNYFKVPRIIEQGN